jgi:hypothetical protein
MRYFAMLLAHVFVLIPMMLYAQDEPQNLSDEEDEIRYAYAVFKSTRIINGQSVEIAPKGEMILTISHHFGRINSGISNFFGLDQSTVRLGLEYGITDRIGISIGRSSFNKMVDGGLKVRLIRQQAGAKRFPVTMVWYSSANVKTLPWSHPEREYLFAHRIAYAHQLLIARKFSPDFSLQVTPSVIHYNLVPLASDYNSIPSLGVGGRYKLLPRLTINTEYFYIPKKYRKPETDLSFSLGMDIETGGHVFQLFFTNSMAIYDPGFIAETTGKWGKGDVFFGFNITRVFTLK